jgi:AraC-like DNA-binding protein
MKIKEFDIQKGIYNFELNVLSATQHAHPVVEIISCTEGSFKLTTHHQSTAGLVFAIIDSNVVHEVYMQDANIQILMLESHNAKLKDFLESLKVDLNQGSFTQTSHTQKTDLFKKIKDFAQQQDLKKPIDTRVETCLSIMQEFDLAYKELIPTLTDQVHLSESRLAHLFKEHIGVSLKKYLVWNKLKNAIQDYLLENKNLTTSSLDNGFFDQSHLSNAFKDILGISPAKAYKSRILQV